MRITNPANVSWKVYTDARFDAVEKATNIALTAQKEAVANALSAQEKATAAALQNQQSKRLGRSEYWGYITGFVGILSLIAALVATFHHA